jgi:hypothetical protein
LKSHHAGAAKIAKKLPWLAHVHQPRLHPAFVCWFVAVRVRPPTHILCWHISSLLFVVVRTRSPVVTQFVATALRRTEQNEIAKWPAVLVSRVEPPPLRNVRLTL